MNHCEHSCFPPHFCGKHIRWLPALDRLATNTSGWLGEEMSDTADTVFSSLSNLSALCFMEPLFVFSISSHPFPVNFSHNPVPVFQCIPDTGPLAFPYVSDLAFLPGIVFLLSSALLALPNHFSCFTYSKSIIDLHPVTCLLYTSRCV